MHAISSGGHRVTASSHGRSQVSCNSEVVANTASTFNDEALIAHTSPVPPQLAEVRPGRTTWASLSSQERTEAVETVLALDERSRLFHEVGGVYYRLEAAEVKRHLDQGQPVTLIRSLREMKTDEVHDLNHSDRHGYGLNFLRSDREQRHERNVHRTFTFSASTISDWSDLPFVSKDAPGLPGVAHMSVGGEATLLDKHELDHIRENRERAFGANAKYGCLEYWNRLDTSETHVRKDAV